MKKVQIKRKLSPSVHGSSVRTVIAAYKNSSTFAFCSSHMRQYDIYFLELLSKNIYYVLPIVLIIYSTFTVCKYFVETNTVTPVIHTPEAKHESSSSSRSPVESPASPVPDSPVIDADLARMEVLLDNWCLDLKRNVLVRNRLCCTM